MVSPTRARHRNGDLQWWSIDGRCVRAPAGRVDTRPHPRMETNISGGRLHRLRLADRLACSLPSARHSSAVERGGAQIHPRWAVANDKRERSPAAGAAGTQTDMGNTAGAIACRPHLVAVHAMAADVPEGC